MKLPENIARRLVKSAAFVLFCTCLLPYITQAIICSSSNTPAQNKNITVRSPNTGTFTSPNFPNPYPLDVHCGWKFFAPPGHIVKLYIDTININAGYFNCFSLPSFDIYDGLKDNKAPKLVSIKCVNNPLKESLKPSFFVLSSGDTMEVYFLATALMPTQHTGYGFRGNYTFEPLTTTGTCSEGSVGTINLRGQGARFSSPGYGSTKYLKNMTCLWNITADPGYTIEIDTVSVKLNSGCKSEFVKVYDGATLNSPILKTFCNEKPNRYLYSSGNNIIVEMKISSSDQKGKGFQMSYRAVKYEVTNYTCPFTIDNRNTVVNVGNPTGKIVSPWYPTGYPNNAFCKWSFNAPSFSSVARVTITKLQLQDSNECKADNVRIYQSNDFSLRGLTRMQSLCDNPQTPITFVSAGRQMMIRFESNWIDAYPGFEAVFDSIEDDSFGGCKVQGQDNLLPLSSSSGAIFSPRYPKPIPPNMMCTWVITAKEGSHIRLQFDKIKLAYECSKGTSVEIRDGPSEASKRLGTYCGFRLPPVIFSSGRQLWVRFTSKGFVNPISETGFHATYDTVGKMPLSSSCRSESVKEIESETGEFASYEYPLNYSINAVCQWRLLPLSSWGKRIKLTFDVFNIQKTPGCSGDFVEVFDGWNKDDKLLGKFCGNEKPEPVYSSGSIMYIRFQSDNQTGPYTGFKASYEIVLNKTSIILIAVGSVVGVIIIIGIIAYYMCKNRCCNESGTRMELENLKS